MIGILKIIYLIIPVGLILGYILFPSHFSWFYGYINSLQGPNGIIVVNAPNEETVGRSLEKYLNSTFPGKTNPDPFWAKITIDLDRTISLFQNYWAWLLIAIIFIIGLVLILTQKDYS